MRKIASAEQKLVNKLAKVEEQYYKVASGPTLKTASGNIPAIYVVCGECQGMGKIASPLDHSVKFASTTETLQALQISVCGACDGEKVVKIADMTQCSNEDVEAAKSYATDKSEGKLAKKAWKLTKRAKKALKRAEKSALKAKDPMAWKINKIKKKAEKSAKKKAKKAAKLVSKNPISV